MLPAPALSDALRLRAAVVLGAVGSHVLLLLLPLPDTRLRPARERSSIWLIPVESTPDLPLPQPSTPASGDGAPRTSSERAAAVPVLSTVTPAPNSPTDWRTSGAQAAEAAVASIIRSEGYQPLGPVEKPKPLTDPPPTPLFEEPKHKLGDVGENAMGYKVVWHNDSCYTVLEAPMSALSKLELQLGQRMCVLPVGESEARGDLFDHIRKGREKAAEARRAEGR